MADSKEKALARLEKIADRYRKKVQWLETKLNAKEDLTTEEWDAFYARCWDTPSSKEPHCTTTQTMKEFGS